MSIPFKIISFLSMKNVSRIFRRYLKFSAFMLVAGSHVHEEVKQTETCFKFLGKILKCIEMYD